MKMHLLLLIMGTFQLVQADQLFIETQHGDVYPSKRYYGYSGEPTPNYQEKHRLAACLTDLRANVKIEDLNQFFAFAVSEKAASLSEMLLLRSRTLLAEGKPLDQGEIPEIQTILRWLVTISKTENKYESRAVFINFFNPDTVGAGCYNAMSAYLAINRLPSYFYLIRAKK